MNKNDKFLAKAWLDYTEAHIKYGINSSEVESTFWAFDKMVDIVRDNPAEALEIIIEISEITDDERILANLGAGPLEDLLVKHGQEIIDEVINLAKKNISFYRLFQYVWGYSIDKEVWKRICNLAA